MDKRSSHDYTKYYDNLVEIRRRKLSIVYKGREIKTKELRAIKVIQLDILKKNIIAKGDEDPEKKLKEYIDGYINECENMRICSNNEGFNAKEIYEILKQLNNVFKIMKENKIIHTDLKLENILIKYENNRRQGKHS